MKLKGRLLVTLTIALLYMGGVCLATGQPNLNIPELVAQSEVVVLRTWAASRTSDGPTSCLMGKSFLGNDTEWRESGCTPWLVPVLAASRSSFSFPIVVTVTAPEGRGRACCS